jgi:hypothetical protein
MVAMIGKRPATFARLRASESTVARADRSWAGDGRAKKPGRYEKFIREGVKESYRAEWHPGEQAPFLGPEKFVKRMAKAKMPPSASKRILLGELVRRQATWARVEPKALRRKGSLVRIVEVRDRFIQEAVFEEGYLASEVARLSACHPSNVSRALQKNNLS